MAIFDDPRCPRCQSAVSLRERWREAPKTRNGFLCGSVGIVCPVCGSKLRVLQKGVVIAFVLSFATLAAVATITGKFERDHRLATDRTPTVLVVVSLAAAMFCLQWRYAYRFASIRILHVGETASFPPVGDDPVEIPDEADIDMALLSQVAAQASRVGQEASSWTCPKCQEDNPGQFDRCWKCQTPH